jgi:hypothetical protein
VETVGKSGKGMVRDRCIHTARKNIQKKLKNGVDRTKTGAILDVYNRYEMLI